MLKESKTEIAVLKEQFKQVHETLSEIKEGECEKHEELKLLLKGLNDKVDLQNGRVRKLEEWRSYLAGALAILGFLIGIGIIKMFGG